MKSIFPLAACLSALLLVGCISAKQFVPLPDQTKNVQNPSQGRIYVMRPAHANGLEPFDVSEGGRIIGKTGRCSYLCWEREPGSTIISSTAEGVSQVALTVEPGSVHYIFQHVRLGMLRSRSELELIDEKQGKKLLKKCSPPKVEPAPPSGIQR